MQFSEPMSKQAQCPVCGKPTKQRSTRGDVPYCSRVCASQTRYQGRYVSTGFERRTVPSQQSKTKFQS